MVAPIDGLVIDASVAAKWYLRHEEFAERAQLVLDRFESGTTALVAPEFIRLEVASALITASARRGAAVTIPQVRAAIGAFQGVRLRTSPDVDLVLPSYELILRYGCALYDAIYLALAQRLGLPFVTADHRLRIRVGHLPEVIWITEYSPPQA